MLTTIILSMAAGAYLVVALFLGCCWWHVRKWGTEWR